ncbi:MAG: hypothetical protein WAP03_17525 [Methylorubrum rhodinum]|uniref:hypothetical protein n=1 Tax=Methylorubrum rhodinum TaxID=29428 RepID=UPI003BB009B6
MSARGTLALALCLMAPLAAHAQDGSLAATTLGQVMTARATVQAECGFDILKESPLGDLSCKSGTRTAVEAWDQALTKAGLPAAERASTAERVGLVPAPEDEPAGLWRADPKDVARLIANLSLKAGG